jgi:hypothetical protein
MNQTAVEFLYEALWEAGKDKFMWQIILQQAKEMEKEYYTEFEVLQLLLKLQHSESYDNLYDWFEKYKKK